MVRSSRSKWAGVLSMGQILIGGQRVRPTILDFFFLTCIMCCYGTVRSSVLSGLVGPD